MMRATEDGYPGKNMHSGRTNQELPERDNVAVWLLLLGRINQGPLIFADVFSVLFFLIFTAGWCGSLHYWWSADNQFSCSFFFCSDTAI